ncbi:MAG: hypothetical protein U0166_22135 [Acidobacteriota bacterium]
MDWEAIAAKPRWAQLRRFVDRFYASPLRREDGSDHAEIEAAEARIGTRLPETLAQWHRLLGRRLGFVQDRPYRITELRSRPDRLIDVWSENQGNWILRVPSTPENPPVAIHDDGTTAWPSGPLSAVLIGMLVGDTLVGAWAGSGRGTLGTLCETVVGGSCATVTQEALAELEARFPLLAWPPNPFYPDPCRGDDDTVLRWNSGCVEWMSANESTYRLLSSILGLDPQDGLRELVVAFEDLSPDDVRAFTETRGKIEGHGMQRLQRALGDAGHLGSARLRPEALLLRVWTRDPSRCWELLRPLFRPGMLDHVTVAHRPEAVARFQVLHPPGLTRFVLPEP